VSRPTRERVAIIEGALESSFAQHHEMELDGSSNASLFLYRCGRCGVTFAVRFQSNIGQSRRKPVLFDRAALDTPCAGAA
jgi:hypothetical protein